MKFPRPDISRLDPGMIVIGCTLVAFKMTGDHHNWSAWLDNAEAVKASYPDVQYVCAIETDARGLEPFTALLARLEEIGGTYWCFSLDDKAQVITTANRLRRICMGHNLVSEIAIEAGATHCLFLASDTQAPDDVIPRMLELNRAAVALHIPTYCLDGPASAEFPFLDIREHMESCACMMLRRDIFIRIKWHTNIDRNMTDDPSMHADLMELLGEKLYVRHDVQATHYPESIPSIEERHTDAERTVIR